jgi:hypothetical protein
MAVAGGGIPVAGWAADQEGAEAPGLTLANPEVPQTRSEGKLGGER